MSLVVNYIRIGLCKFVPFAILRQVFSAERLMEGLHYGKWLSDLPYSNGTEDAPPIHSSDRRTSGDGGSFSSGDESHPPAEFLYVGRPDYST